MTTRSGDSDEQPSWKGQHRVGKGDHLQLTEGVAHGSKMVTGVAERGARVRQSDAGLSSLVIWPQGSWIVEPEVAEPIHQEKTTDAVFEVLDSLYC